MSSNLAPLIIGIFAAGLLLTLIGITLATWRPVERIQLNRRTRKSADAATSVEWIYFPRQPPEETAGQSGRTAEADARVEAKRGGQGSTAAIEVAGAGRASLLVAADKQREALPRDNEAEADRIVEEARRQAKELLEEAELEAKRIVDATVRERAEVVEGLALERSLLEQTRRRLHGFMVDALEEVESPSAATEELAHGRQLDEASRMGASTDSDH
jgi:hypothetical protein